jgi:hypothetical protein
MNPEEWLREYQHSRYLRQMNDNALAQRLDFLVSNLWSTDAAGNVIPTRNATNRHGIIRLISHVLFEQNERLGIKGCEFDEAATRKAAAATYQPPKLRKAFSGITPCFAKFGKRKHISEAYDKGVLKIAPASSYDDPSLNPAQADKELEHVSITPNEHLKYRIYGLDCAGNEVEIPVQQKELFRYMNVPDFYVWCCGLGYDARLFQAFEADAALIVRDKEAFRSRLSKSVAKLLPNANPKNGPIMYYDPYTIRREQLVPVFSKHICYLYQNEYRFAWSVASAERLKPLFLELGSLHDIAEFLEVD